MNSLAKRIKHHSIRTRMLLLLCSVVAVIFLIVFLGFNLFLEDYIATSVYTPLQKVVALSKMPRLNCQNCLCMIKTNLVHSTFLSRLGSMKADRKTCPKV